MNNGDYGTTQHRGITQWYLDLRLRTSTLVYLSPVSCLQQWLRAEEDKNTERTVNSLFHEIVPRNKWRLFLYWVADMLRELWFFSGLHTQFSLLERTKLQDDVLWWWWKVGMSKLMEGLKNQLKVKQKGHEKASNRALEFWEFLSCCDLCNISHQAIIKILQMPVN